MNLTGILVSIAIGTVSAVVGYFVLKFALRDDEESRKKYALTVVVALFAAISYLSYIAVSPLIVRMGFERIVSGAIEQVPYLAYLKKYDRATYVRIVDEFIDQYQKAESPSDAGKIALSLGQKYLIQYLAACGDDVMMKFGRLKLDMLRELVRLGPLYVLKSEYPKIYGYPPDLTRLLSPELSKRYRTILLDVAGSGLSNQNGYFNAPRAQLALQRKVLEFARDFPGYYPALVNFEPRKTEISQKQLADSIIKFYEYLLVLNTNDSPKILKLTIAGTQ